MKAFEYVAPTGAAEAVEMLAGRDNSLALSGGTDLLDRMKDGLDNPDRIVYIRGIEGHDRIDLGNNGLKLGANARLADLADEPKVWEQYPALAVAARAVGTPQIRNMATVGGNLMQRPRCWYYRHGFGLLGGRRDEQGRLIREHNGEQLPYSGAGAEPGHLVRNGDNRYHAIFLTDGDALFVNPSNLAAALIALGATATILGPGGKTRTVPVEALYRVPKAEGERELTLEPGELVTEVVVPPAQGKNATYEVRWKQSHDWPLVLASVCCELKGETVARARIVLSQVAPIPWRSEAAEKAIVGKAITEETAAAAGAAAVAEAKPLSQNAYKVAIARTVVTRALLSAAGKTTWQEEG